MAGRMTIFVVDDDDSMRRALGRLLTAAGMTSVEFESAEQLLESNDPPPDCIVSDIHLPNLSGFEMVKRARRRLGEVPVIFVTAFDTQNSRNEASRHPRSSYLPKPFEGVALLRAIWSITTV